jgi:hypothetical protein
MRGAQGWGVPSANLSRATTASTVHSRVVYLGCPWCGHDLTGRSDEKYCGPACQRAAEVPELAFLSCFVLAAIAVSRAESVLLDHEPYNISSALMATRRG